MRIEKSIEDFVVSEAERDGWVVRKIKFIGRRSAPDRLFYKKGRVVFIEFKSPGETATEGQGKEIALMGANEVEAFVCDNPFSALKLLGVKVGR